MDRPPFEAVGVVGLGLIGGSLLRRIADTCTAIGFDADRQTRAAARAAGFDVADTVAETVRRSDLLVIAVPLPAVVEVVRAAARSASARLLVTDVVSVKEPVLELVSGTGLTYVGGHPMAGTERSGFAAGDPALFQGARWVLCLEPETPLDAWLRLAALVTRLGCLVVPATAAEHDTSVARSSHLQHLLAAVAADAVAGDPLARSLAAGSFRDTTRVAATAPATTAAMCSGNAAALGAELELAIERLGEARRLLGAGADLVPWLRRAAAARAAWPTPLGAAERWQLSGIAVRSRLLDLGRWGGVVEAVDADSVTVRRPARGPE